MYNVSQKYIDIMNETVRSETFLEIKFGIINPNAPQTSTITDNGSVFYSNSSSVDLGFNVLKTYETLEKNRFILDGENLLPPMQNYIYQGYVSDVVSNEQGLFTTNPKITVEFSEYYIFSGLTFIFDEIKNDYPTQFKITAYNGVEISLQETININEAYYSFGKQIPQCNKLELEFLNTKIPNRRARLSSLIFGIIDILKDKNISSFTFSHKTDLISKSLPTQDFSFTIFDVDNKYNPENPDNLLKYLENGQFVTCVLYQNIGNDEYESIPIFNGYTTGEVSTSNAGFVKEISITSTSILDFLDKIYDEGVYYPNGRSLLDLANDVMNFAGYGGTLDLDDALSTISTDIILNGLSVKQCLQLIANCGVATLNINRNGTIQIKTIKPNPATFEFSFDKMTNIPSSNRIPQIRNIFSKYYKTSVETILSELTSINVENAVNTEYNIQFPLATEIEYSLTGLTVVGVPKIYAGKINIVLNGTGKIIIKGKKINVTEIEFSKKYNEIGTDLTMSNTLVNSKSFCENYCDKLKDYYSRRSTYQFENRGYPYLDILDDFNTQTNYDGVVNSTLIENEISFNGALKGKSKTLTLVKDN